jgi:hypothetical protein
MSMMLKVLTLPFVPALGGFGPALIEAIAAVLRTPEGE